MCLHIVIHLVVKTSIFGLNHVAALDTAVSYSYDIKLHDRICGLSNV